MDRAGNLTGWAERFRRADVEQQLRQRALDAIANGVLIADAQLPDLPIIYVNEAFATMTGYAPAEVLGRNCRFLQGEDRAQPDLPRIRAAIAEGRPVHAQLRNYRKDGTLFWNELFLAPVRDAQGRLTHFVGVQQDVTERKQLEHQVQKQLERLTELDRTRQLFVNYVVHELRSPLTSVKGFVELLEDGYAGPLEDEQREYVSRVQVGLGRVLRLVDELLDAARLEGGTFRLERRRVDLCALIADVASDFRPQAELASVRLVVDCAASLPAVEADPGRLVQVLTNLMSNALRYSPRGALVRLEAEARRGGVVCRVVDFGVGIPPEEAERLFKPYSQLASSSQPGGTGLGLSLSKSIIEAHGGQIGFESRPDGSTFWFFLPSDAPTAP